MQHKLPVVPFFPVVFFYLCFLGTPQICWMSYKSMWNPLTWLMVSWLTFFCYLVIVGCYVLNWGSIRNLVLWGYNTSFTKIVTCNSTDLHSIGGLVPLLGYLKNSHDRIRSKAAEVVTTIVQNNPKSQQLVMEANGFEPLMANFASDPDVTVRTKALGAISCK